MKKVQKIQIPQTSKIFNRMLGLSIICDERGSNRYKVFIAKESIEILKILCLINNNNNMNE